MKIKNQKALKKFSKLYEDYKILDFKNNNIFDSDDYKTNIKLILESLGYLNELVDEVDPTTPTTYLTANVIVEGYVTEKRYTEVQLNLKDWQKALIDIDGNPQLRGIIKILTGFKDN